MDLAHTALLIIDSQRGFEHLTHWGPSRSNPSYETNITALLSAFRALRSASPQAPLPTPPAGPLIIHILHASTSPSSPLHPNNDGFASMPYSAPQAGEVTIRKSVNSAFIGTDLEATLRRAGVRRLYVAGLSTDHCVSTTVRMAGNLGVCDWVGDDGEEKGEVVLVQDATAAWEKNGGEWDAETVHRVHVESLREFAVVRTTGEVLAEVGGGKGV